MCGINYRDLNKSKVFEKAVTMEYLPEKKRTQKTQIIKKEAKIRQFRQELVDNNVVLAIVKCKSRSSDVHINILILSLNCNFCRLGRHA